MRIRAQGFLIISSILILSMPSLVFAAGANMPWETPLNNILSSCTGPLAKGLGSLAILSTGLGVAFGEGGGFMRKALSLCLGLSIAFTASTFMLDFFGYGGGVGF